jgi:hypothetical protein
MFYELPYIYVILPCILFVFGVAVGLLFLYRKHPKWNRDLPILIAWSLMLIAEVTKQIYYQFISPDHPNLSKLPFTFCAMVLIFYPGYVLCNKYHWKRGIGVFAPACYVISLCLLTSFIIYPRVIIWGLQDDANIWNYLNISAIIYHSIMCFASFWFFIHHTYKLKWFDLIWFMCIVTAIVLLFILLSYLLDCDFAHLWQYKNPTNPKPWSESWRLTLIYTTVYIGGGGIGFVLWKLLIQRFVPNFIDFRNKNIHR